jgi:Uri superfamily endonuclease
MKRTLNTSSQRIAAYQQPNLDELVAMWFARRYLTGDNLPETGFYSRNRPFGQEGSFVDKVEPRPMSLSDKTTRRKKPSFSERYANSATGRLWTHLLELGRPVAQHVDLVDAVHTMSVTNAEVPSGAVWKPLWNGLRKARTQFTAKAADDQSLCQSLHHWLDQYEARLGLGAVVTVGWEKVAKHFPAEPGTYALVLQTAAPGGVLLGRTGNLGRMEVADGSYVYSGSACGTKTGIRGRQRRHLTLARELKLKWQVDFLRLRCSVVEVWFTTDSFPSDLDLKAARSARECAFAMSVLTMAGATVPVPGFGSPEHRNCPAYLAHFETKPSFRAFQREVERSEWPCRLQRVIVG